MPFPPPARIALVDPRTGQLSPAGQTFFAAYGDAISSDFVPTSRTISTANGLTGGGTLAANRTLELTGQALALHQLAASGIIVRTGPATVAARTITFSGDGVAISNGNGISGNPTLALANDLAALEAMSGTGLVARTAADTYAQRSIAGTAGEISVTNGDGVAGNPTLALPSALTFTSKTVTGGVYSGGTFSGTFDGAVGSTSPNTGTFTGLTASGTASVAGAATVGGSATFGATVSVGGAATVTGAATFGSAVSVSGNATLSGAVTMASTASVDGAATVGGSLSVSGTANVTGAATIGGGVTGSSTASIAGAVTVGGALTASSTTTVTGALTASAGILTGDNIFGTSSASAFSMRADGSGGGLVVYGSTSGLGSRCYVYGSNGVYFPEAGTTATAANAVLDNGSGNIILRSTSSLAYKTGFEPIDMEIVRSAGPQLLRAAIWYRSTAPHDRPDWSWYGMGAETVAAIDPRLVHWRYDDADCEFVADPERPFLPPVRTPRPGAELKPDGVAYDRVALIVLLYLADRLGLETAE